MWISPASGAENLHLDNLEKWYMWGSSPHVPTFGYQETPSSVKTRANWVPAQLLAIYIQSLHIIILFLGLVNSTHNKTW